MRYEDPRALLGRLALGREEYCQRLLTMLILGGEYPRWNTRSTPAAEGARFLRLLDELSFGRSRCTDPIVFVDELELAPRHTEERGGAPDYALLWPDRVWMVELKTEPASHRPDQLPSYFRLGAHHYPDADLDITYLTPPMDKPPPQVEQGQRYAHLSWAQVAPLVEQVWEFASDADVVRVRDGLLETIGDLDVPVAQWRERAVAAPATGVFRTDLAVQAARLVAADGEQRVVDVPAEDLQALHDLRLELEAAFTPVPELRHVKPWLWNATTSGGMPLSSGGAEHGFEIRLSRYRNPVR